MSDKCLVSHEYTHLSTVGPMAIYLDKTHHLKHDWQASLDARFEVCARCRKTRPRQDQQQREGQEK